MALVSPPRTLAARCRVSMSAWSVLIWACLAAMAAAISFMAGTVLAELEGCQHTDPRARPASTTAVGGTPAPRDPVRGGSHRPAQPSAKRKRKPWSAAAKKAMSKRIKASWAKRNKKSGKKAAAPKAKPKRKQHQWSAAEKAAIGKRMKAYWAKRRKAKG